MSNPTNPTTTTTSTCTATKPSSITIITSPYHAGRRREEGVSSGPDFIRGVLVSALEESGLFSFSFSPSSPASTTATATVITTTTGTAATSSFPSSHHGSDSQGQSQDGSQIQIESQCQSQSGSRRVPVYEVEIPPISDEDGEEKYKGEIGCTFEILRRTSTAVSAARESGSFPIVLAGNCVASVGVAAGLCFSHLSWDRDGGENGITGDGNENGHSKSENKLGCVWFDAHDDYNVPDTIVSGYFDSQGIAMLAGESWKTLLTSIPGFQPVDLARVIHCGVRDVNERERERVERSGMGAVWGDVHGGRADYVGGLRRELESRFGDNDSGTGTGEKDGSMLLHLDLDVLDVSIGKANAFACPGGLTREDLLGCLEAVLEKTTPLALTVASFDPGCDGEEAAGRIAGIAVEAVQLVAHDAISRP